MQDASVNILIGGEAGQGLATVGTLISNALVREGYEIHVTQDYMSRIRGGHNTFAVRMGPEPLLAPREDVDVLVALNRETVELHQNQLSERGVVVVDESIEVDHERVFSVPFKELAPKPIFHNTVALGVLAAVVCSSLDVLENMMAETFGKKGEDVVKQNIEVLRASYEWKKKHERLFDCPAPAEGESRLTMSGNEAIAMGALAAGANFCSFYPMTPSTSVVLNLIAKGKDLGVVVEQAEDEIAALNMALGASCAGARAMTATSGGGFALMIEGVSLAGMTETPIVIILAQRPGPATGLPTRTEQGDLNMVLHAGHGEFPRAIFAPGSVEECFHLTHRAFDMTEKHQSPAFVLTDQYLADSYRAVEPFDLDALPEVASPLTEIDDPASYKRYALTDSGVSPRLIPGFTEGLVVIDSDEHDETGHITEDFEVRVAMADKRNRKFHGLLADVVPPRYEGSENPEWLMVCWGSTLGAALEARAHLEAEGLDAAVLHFAQVWPLAPDTFLPRLSRARNVVMVEGNSTGHLKGLIRLQTGYDIDKLVSRYDGLPFTADYITSRIKRFL